jgi:hypothetical protein
MHHKDLDLWVPGIRRYDAPQNTTATITIERSASPLGSGYWFAKIPIGGSATNFYTVEARHRTGYDNGIPGDAIVIHNVLTTRSDRDAQVVDATIDNNPNDAGAMWTVGETVTDTAQGISVTVNSLSSSGFSVTISRSSGVPGAATLVSPSGAISTKTPTFTWNAVPGASSYYLWVNDTSAAPRIAQWMSATDANCGSGTGNCSASPSVVLASGAGRWFVQTWNSFGYGPWSAALDFSIVGLVAPTLMSPTGTISSSGPTFTWNAVSGATYYYLWVNDSGSAPKFTGWFTTTATGCGAGTGTCSTAIGVPLNAGAGRWWARAWNPTDLLSAWSTPLDFTVPGVVAGTLISPSGAITTSTPTYMWNAVPGATYYYLWVNDSTAQPKITQWFSATDAGCPTGSGVCSGTPTVAIAPGAGRWWIRSWNETQGYGPWSTYLDFTR